VTESKYLSDKYRYDHITTATVSFPTELISRQSLLRTACQTATTVVVYFTDLMSFLKTNKHWLAIRENNWEFRHGSQWKVGEAYHFQYMASYWLKIAQFSCLHVFGASASGGHYSDFTISSAARELSSKAVRQIDSHTPGSIPH